MSDKAKGYQKLQSSSSENEDRATKGVQILSPKNLEANLASTDALAKPQDAVPGVGTGDIVLFTPSDNVGDTPNSTDIMGTMKNLPDTDGDDGLVEVDLTDEDQKKKKSIWDRVKGILAMFISAILTSLCTQIFYYVFDKREGITCSKSLFFFWACVFYIIFNYIPFQYALCKSSYYIVQPFKDDKKLWWLLVIRGLIGSVIPFAMSHAIDRFHMPAPLAVVTAMAPILVYFNAYFVLGEPLGLIPVLNVFVAIAGVLIMNLNELTHPNKESMILEGTGIAFTVMVGLSWVAVVLRMLRTVNPFLVNLAYGLGGFIVQGIIVLFEHDTYWLYNNEALLFSFALGVITTCSNFLFNISLKYETAGVVSLIKTTEVLFSFLFQFMFFKIEPNAHMAIGGAMILFGVLCVTLRKIVGESSETSRLRKHFWFLLY